MFKLKWPNFPNPSWFSSRSFGEPIEGKVISKNTVFTDNDKLELIDGEMPPEGTMVIIFPEKYFLVGKTLQEVEAENKEKKEKKEAKIKEEEEKRKQFEKSIRVKAEVSNKKLNIPVEWTSGFKSVLSGLSEKGWGNGINKKSVVHILLKDDINEGKFKRKSGSFLCTSNGGSDGMQYVDLERLSFDDEGSYVSEITCKSCQKVAARWEKQLKKEV